MGTHTFVATGDSIITRRVADRKDKPFLDMVELIRGADSAFTNLEIVTPKEPWIPNTGPLGSNLGSPPFILDELKWMGFNLYGAANNHSIDFTFVGLVDTMEALKERDLVYAGAGMTLGEARKPAYFDTPAGRVGLVACASTFDESAQAAASRSDVGGRPGLSPMRFETEYVVNSEQLAALGNIDQALGTDAVTSRWREIFDNPNPEAYKFLGSDFVEGETPRVSTHSKESDLEQIADAISEARQHADLVVATIHAHEGQNGDLNTQDIADFIVPMARRWIDAGADIFVGHGPHTLRALEIYKGKPIFYSLGNFFFTSSTNPRNGAEVYEKQGLPPSATPEDLKKATLTDEEGNYKHMNGDPQFWRAVMPICRFEGRELVDIELHPVELGFDLPEDERGVPVLADSEVGAMILQNLQELSAPFGTELKIESTGERAVARLQLN